MDRVLRLTEGSLVEEELTVETIEV